MKLAERATGGRAIVDWLSFTVPCENLMDLGATVEEWVSRLGGGVERDNSRYFYSKSVQVLDSGLILYHPERVDMGVHISLPASAVAKLEVDPVRFLGSVKGAGGVVSRLDVAMDTERVHIDTVEKSIRDGELVSASQKRLLVEDISERKEGGGKYYGKTLYIGAPSSMRRVRIYDKAAEQGVDGVWTRCEVQLRKEHAQTAADALLAGVHGSDIIASSLDFRALCGDSNVTRHEQLAWWSDWLTYAQGVVSFALEQVNATVESMKNWIENQVAPTLAFFMVVEGGDTGWFMDCVRKGYEKLPQWKLDRAKALAA